MGSPRKNKWFIAIKKRGEDLFDLSGLTVIEPPADHYMADPFLFSKDGKHYLFHELYDYDKGRIAYSEFSFDGDKLVITDPKVVIDVPYHMSFPGIFEDNGRIYMLPETGQSGRLEIWEAIRFPDVWVLSSVVTGGCFGDPIFYKQADEYQIYATEGDNDLRIFTASSLKGPWHLKLLETVEHSRSAGNLFMFVNKLLRPVQDCIGTYGRAIYFKNAQGKIEYAINPDWYPGLTGTHTFNFNKDFVVIDGRIKL